jgi:hypothetical protein
MRHLPKFWLGVIGLLLVFALIQLGTANPIVPQEETHGTITNLLPDELKFEIISYDGRPMRFQFEEDPVITINEMPAALEELRISDNVRVVYWIDEADLYAFELHCKR